VDSPIKVSSPIGVFDSGLGGLTVLKSLREQLPYEAFLYLGDVARLPYGTKSPIVVKKYASRCVDYLIGQGVKAVVVACNTATAAALDDLRENSTVPVLGVIEPGGVAATLATSNKKILVAGTHSTVSSGAYVRYFQERSEGYQVKQVACPLLVPLAEEGWFDHDLTCEVIRHYLTPYQSFGFDTCLLGCTHYPLLEAAFKRVLGQGIAVVHGADTLALELAATLGRLNLLNPQTQKRSPRLLSTDSVSLLSPIPAQLFGPGSAFESIDL